MSEVLLALSNVTMRFGGVTALGDVNIQVKKGEILALIGPNGAGKTTVFNVITGVYRPTSGSISSHEILSCSMLEFRESVQLNLVLLFLTPCVLILCHLL